MLQRRPVLSSLVVFLVLTASCALHAKTERSAPQGEPFRLAYGEEVEVDNAEFSLHFVEVLEDSRCPVEVQCFWQGNARLQVDVVVGDATVEKLVLNTVDRGDMEMSSEANWGDFTIALTDLLPAKSQTGPEASEYTAVLQVTPRVTEEE